MEFNVPDIECRIAKLEEGHSNLIDRIVEMREGGRRTSDKIFEKLEDIETKIQSINIKDVSRAGYFAGIITVFTVIGSFSVWVIEHLLRK